MLYLFYDVSKNLQAGVLKDANTGNSDWTKWMWYL